MKGHIEEIPLADATVDVVISNCVINLSGDKPAVLREVARVLRPGGRFAVSDVIADPGMDEATRRDMQQWTGCVAGALTRAEFESALAAAGPGRCRDPRDPSRARARRGGDRARRQARSVLLGDGARVVLRSVGEDGMLRRGELGRAVELRLLGDVTRVGINGFGRMGRLALRAGWGRPDLTFAHINEIAGDAATAAHLLTFDSVHGRFDHDATGAGEALAIDETPLPTAASPTPAPFRGTSPEWTSCSNARAASARASRSRRTSSAACAR